MNAFHLDLGIKGLAHGKHDLQLILLPYLIAILGCYLTLDVISQLRARPEQRNFLWILAGSLSLGISIWVVHFIGIIAFNLPVTVGYNLLVIAMSLLVFVAAAFCGLALLKNINLTTKHYFFAGIPIGIIIAAGYYLGLEAIINIKISYKISILLFSVAFAIIASEMSLWLASKSSEGPFKRQIALKIVTAIFVSICIYLMHFLTLKASVFTVDNYINTTKISVLNKNILLLYLVEISLVMLAIPLAISTYKQAVNIGLKKQNAELLETRDKLKQKSKALEHANALMKDLAAFPEENLYPIMRIMGNGKLLFANHASEPLLKLWDIKLGASVPNLIRKIVNDSLETEKLKKLEVNAGNKIFLVNFIPIKRADYVNLYVFDITEQNRIENKLRLSNSALEACPDGVIICDAAQYDIPIVYVNPAFERITGYSAAEVIGRNCRFLQNTDREQPDLIKLKILIEEHQSGQVVIRNYRKDGTLFWNELHIASVVNSAGKVTYFVGIIIDITAHKILEDQLIHQATHDSLTDLPNRVLLLDRIQQAISQARRDGLYVAVLFFDLDRFKLINDSLGHRIGDVVLQTIAKRLIRSVRGTDTVTRLGGDEFVVALAGLKDEADALPIIKKCQQALKEFFLIEEHRFILTASIGVSFYPKDGSDANTLLKNADGAMYWAKDSGGNNFQFYKSGMALVAKEKLEYEHYLRYALERQEFVLHYQPIFDLRSGHIVGAEALLRWNHPKLGLLLPREFVAVLEETGLIIDVGEWVLRTACFQNTAWHNMGLPSIKIAVNISGLQLKKRNIAHLISEILQESKLDPKNLEIELMESAFVEATPDITAMLENIRKMNVGLVIDDFGIGYSNLNLLSQFPVYKIKIDRVFIQNVEIDPKQTSLVLAIINIGKELGLKVLAEGIETEAQLQFLQAKGCDQAQGFYFGQPVPSEDFARLVRESFKF